MSKYEIEKIKTKEKYYEVYINADSNDGDYISRKERFSQEQFDEVIDGLIDLQNNYSESHQLENYPNKYDLSIPYNGWDGYCHSLEELTVKMYDTDGIIYNVKF